MMVINHPDEINSKILQMLGVTSENVRKAVITLEVGCSAVVSVETYADELNDDGELDVMLQDYELVPKEPDLANGGVLPLGGGGPTPKTMSVMPLGANGGGPSDRTRGGC